MNRPGSWFAAMALAATAHAADVPAYYAPVVLNEITAEGITASGVPVALDKRVENGKPAQYLVWADSPLGPVRETNLEPINTADGSFRVISILGVGGDRVWLTAQSGISRVWSVVPGEEPQLYELPTDLDPRCRVLRASGEWLLVAPAAWSSSGGPFYRVDSSTGRWTQVAPYLGNPVFTIGPAGHTVLIGRPDFRGPNFLYYAPPGEELTVTELTGDTAVRVISPRLILGDGSPIFYERDSDPTSWYVPPGGTKGPPLVRRWDTATNAFDPAWELDPKQFNPLAAGAGLVIGMDYPRSLYEGWLQVSGGGPDAVRVPTHAFANQVLHFVVGSAADGVLAVSNPSGLHHFTLLPDDATLMLLPSETAPCTRADVTTTGAAPGSNAFHLPDGVLDGADLAVGLDRWLAGGVLADLNTTHANPGESGYGAPDGRVNGADLSYFVEQWIGGCP